jgi:NAD(P)-dependent dehydrogenase (short-subunit alcohol dehydrogenase family)
VGTFDGQIAMVTGAASGIGRQIRADLIEHGATVVAVDRSLEAFSALPGAERLLPGVLEEADVTDAEAIGKLVNATVRNFGKIDILIHSAGIGLERAFLETTREQWNQLIAVDLTGTFVTCQAVARSMAERGYGRIVTLASAAGIRGGTGRAAYGAAKGGVITLTKVMAVELAEFGITANALAPGAIETELVKRMHSAETRHVYQRAIPMDRYGTPAEVSAVALFLVSPAAAYVTGQVIGVDGGFMAAGVLHRRGAHVT